MKEKFSKMFAAVETALTDLKKEKDLLAALDALPSPKELPPPIATWLLFVLLRYHHRQQWARNFVREHLPEACPPSAALCRREQPVCLPVPGMANFRLFLNAHDQTAYLHCDRPPEIFCVDVTADGKDSMIVLSQMPFDIHAECRWSPESAWQKLLPLDKSGDYGDSPEVDDLRKAEFLEAIKFEEGDPLMELDGDAHRLTDSALRHQRLVERLRNAMKAPTGRVLMAAAVGDWGRAHWAACEVTDPDVLSLLASRRRECVLLHNEDCEFEEIEIEP